MKTNPRPVSLVIQLMVGLVFCAVPVAVSACGFHTQVSISRALLSWNYPDASHVSGAVWAAQQAGTLDMPDPKRLMATGAELQFLESAEFAAVVKALYALAESFEHYEGGHTSLALVLIERMLWTRYPTSGVIEPHVRGPQSGDLVVVTDAPVLHAIEKGRLSMAEAAETGLLRLYGNPEQEASFISSYGSLGAKPLPQVDEQRLLALMLGGRFKGGTQGETTTSVDDRR